MVQRQFLTRSGSRKSFSYCCIKKDRGCEGQGIRRVLWPPLSGPKPQTESLQEITEQGKLFLVTNSAAFKSPHSASNRTIHERAVHKPRLRKMSRQIDLRTASQCTAHLSEEGTSRQPKVIESQMGKKKNY